MITAATTQGANMHATHDSPDRAAVLTQATLRAAEQLGLSSRELAQVLGVSEASISRLKSSARKIHPESKEADLALTLIRIFRSLDPLVGGDSSLGKRWMASPNQALTDQTPKALIVSINGLARTLAYLDGMRAAT